MYNISRTNSLNIDLGKLLKHVQDQGILPSEPEFIKRTEWIRHQRQNKVADSYKPTDIIDIAKHLMQHRGPAVISHELSSNPLTLDCTKVEHTSGM